MYDKAYDLCDNIIDNCTIPINNAGLYDNRVDLYGKVNVLYCKLIDNLPRQKKIVGLYDKIAGKSWFCGHTEHSDKPVGLYDNITSLHET